MEKDIHELLRESGYLASPANRFFWKNATPTLRTHLRHYLLAAGSAGLPIAAMVAWLSLLKGRDALLLSGFYLLVFMVGTALLDLVLGQVLRLRSLESFWSNSRWLNLLPVPVAGLTLLLLGRGLLPLLRSEQMIFQIPAWAALAVCAWLIGQTLFLLLVSRLYWHGIRPPHLHRYHWLTSIVLALVLVLHLLQAQQGSLVLPPVQHRPPTLILALDLPLEEMDSYAAMFPNWPSQQLTSQEQDITNFWTELATGAPALNHQTSLVVFQTPLFRHNLNQNDPSQRLPLQLFKALGLARPVTGGGRYRKYFWEIMDDYLLRTYAFGFWHSFPASSQNGGVLSERWQPENRGNSQNPSQIGLPQIEVSDPLVLDLDQNLQPSLDRENQIWAQLQQVVNQNEFDLCLAYLPLADLLPRQSPLEPSPRQPLQTWRAGQVNHLLKGLPQGTRVLVLLSSGKPLEQKPEVSLHLISNWLPEIADPLESHLELAATLLADYRIPADRLMKAARYKLSLDISDERLDYGEPDKQRKPQPKADRNYYEELKSLGYVK